MLALPARPFECASSTGGRAPTRSARSASTAGTGILRRRLSAPGGRWSSGWATRVAVMGRRRAPSSPSTRAYGDAHRHHGPRVPAAAARQQARRLAGEQGQAALPDDLRSTSTPRPEGLRSRGACATSARCRGGTRPCAPRRSPEGVGQDDRPSAVALAVSMPRRARSPMTRPSTSPSTTVWRGGRRWVGRRGRRSTGAGGEREETLQHSGDVVRGFLDGATAAEVRGQQAPLSAELESRDAQEGAPHAQGQVPCRSSRSRATTTSQVAFPDGYGPADLESLSFLDTAEGFVFHYRDWEGQDPPSRRRWRAGRLDGSPGAVPLTARLVMQLEAPARTASSTAR